MSEAYGDQCEACGTSLSTDLKNPKSTISGSAPVLKKTTHWYLPLDKHEPFLQRVDLAGAQGMEEQCLWAVQELD